MLSAEADIVAVAEALASGVAVVAEADALASGVAAGVAVELWLREITMIARSAIPAITVTTTRDEEFVCVAALLFATGAAGAAFAAGVVEIEATEVADGITILAGAFFAAFLATFLAGAFFATFLATRFAGAFLAAGFFAAAFLATFLTVAFLATRLAATFLATFLAGAFLATFFLALFFTATAELLGFAGVTSMLKGY